MEIKACYQDKIFKSDDGFCIFRYGFLDKNIPSDFKAPDFIATGYLLPESGKCILKGEKTIHRKYGPQLKVDSFVEICPEEKDEIEEWLIKGKFKGMGPVTVRKLVKKFGKETIEIINTQPEKIIKFLGKKKGNAFINDYNSKKTILKLFPILEQYKLSLLMAKRVLKKFEAVENLPELLMQRPYLLCLVEGITFSRIDDIERNKPTFNAYSKDRISFGINNVIKENELSGHLFIHPNELLTSITKVLPSVSVDYIKMIVNEQVKKGNLFFQNAGIYTKSSYYDEDLAAKKIVELLKYPPIFTKEKVETALNSCMDKIQLDEIQKQAIITGLISCVSIITGGPGRGKTAILNTLIKTLKKLKKDIEIACCAPTGRAARRMEESVDEYNNITFSTIHSLLNIRPGEEDYANPVSADVILVDESSMIGQHLLRILVENISVGKILIFIGDANQLPSVEPGEVLGELIRSTIIPTTFLKKVYRQSDNSSIFLNSQKIEEKDTNLIYDDSFRLIHCETEQDVKTSVENLIRNELKDTEYQILTPLRHKTEIGCVLFNPFLQDIINPSKKSVKCFGSTWSINDKVINLKNEDDVNNGDMGLIKYVVPDGDEAGIEVAFENGITKFFGKEEMLKLELAYAITVHKSQGGEYPVVILPFINAMGRMRLKRLFYTAVTRAKEKIIILGNEESIKIAINNVYAEKRRNTYFADRLYTYYREEPLI